MILALSSKTVMPPKMNMAILPEMNMVIPPEMNMVMPPEMNMVICNCCVVEQECNAAKNEHGKTARNEHC